MKRLSLSSYLFSALAFLLVAASCSTGKRIQQTRKDDNKQKKEQIVRIQKHKMNRDQKALLAEARSWLGTPYKYAEDRKGEGTDCSGFVMRVYEKVTGKKLPRNSAQQAEFCIPVKKDDVEAGDLVFFATGSDPNRVSHVGIMLDREQFVHASSSKGVVISRLEGSYFPKRLLMFGRVPD